MVIMMKVFYDGSCGLCSREIAFYKRLPSTAPIEWVDIARNSDVLAEHGLSFEEAMRFFHIVGDDGNIRSGVDAFLYLWAKIVPFQSLGFIVGLPVIKPIALWSYAKFANWRFKRRKMCPLP
jgi:predicted DCC family thiol-disulfide oxidoreductase YuxK